MGSSSAGTTSGMRGQVEISVMLRPRCIDVVPGLRVFEDSSNFLRAGAENLQQLSPSATELIRRSWER